MNRWRLFCIVGSVFALPAAATAAWDVGLESVSPTGSFADFAGGGGGLYVQHSRPMKENVLLSGYAGAIAYGGAKIPGLEFQRYGYPITIGGAYYARGVDAGGFFVKANAGLLVKVANVEFLGVARDENSETGHVLSPGVGWDFGRINVVAEYNLGSNDWTWFAVKAAHRFGR